MPFCLLNVQKLAILIYVATICVEFANCEDLGNQDYC